MAGTTLVFAPLSGRLVGPPRRPAAARPRGRRDNRQRADAHEPRAQDPTDYLLAAYFLFGFGFGLVNPPITDTAVAGMPPAQAGVAAGVASTSRQVGQTLGVAVLGAVAGGALAGHVGRSFAAATHPAWWIVACIGVLIVVIGLFTTTAWAKATARDTASRFGDVRPRRYRAGEALPARASAP